MRDNGKDVDSDSNSNAVADDGLPQVRVAINEGNNNSTNSSNGSAAYVKAEAENRSSQINQHAADASIADRWRWHPTCQRPGWHLDGVWMRLKRTFHHP